MKSPPDFKALRFKHFFINEYYYPYVVFLYIPIFVFFSFSLRDYFSLGDEFSHIFYLRIAISIFMFAVISFYIKNKSKWLEISEVLCLAVIAIFLIYYGRFSIYIEKYDNQNGMIILMMYLGSFSRLSIKPSVLVLSFIFFIYLIGLSPLLYEISPSRQVDQLVTYSAIYTFVVFSCARRELEVRKRFLYSQDVRKKSNQLLNQSKLFEGLSYKDALTGCYNRLYLNKVVEPSINFQSSITSVMLDIDYFKSINDNYGHHSGDEVIKELSKSIKKIIPNSGKLFRYGGEEFLVIVQGETEESINLLVDSLLLSPLSLRETVTFALRENVTVSIGVKYCERTNGSIDELIEAADRALYLSKRGGRNRVTWCD